MGFFDYPEEHAVPSTLIVITDPFSSFRQQEVKVFQSTENIL